MSSYFYNWQHNNVYIYNREEQKLSYILVCNNKDLALDAFKLLEKGYDLHQTKCFVNGVLLKSTD
jgi:hypothetical protein